MYLLEDHSLIKEQKSFYVPNPLKPPLPPPVPTMSKNETVFAPRVFAGGELSNKLLLEVKEALLKRIDDPDRIKKFKQEIEELKQKLSKKK